MRSTTTWSDLQRARSTASRALAGVAGALGVVYLDERHADLGEAVPKRLLIAAQAALEPVQKGAQRVDRQLCLRQLGGSVGEMEGGKLPKPHGVVGDDQLHGRFYELLAHGVEFLFGLTRFFGRRLPVVVGRFVADQGLRR